jgi:hypothetical protein
MPQDVLMLSVLRGYQIQLEAVLLDNFPLYCYARGNKISKCVTLSSRYPLFLLMY